jgi:hypothetical protein
MRVLIACLLGVGWAAGAAAIDVGVAADRLVVVDKLAVNAKAKAVFVSHDGAIDKGTGTATDQIAVRLDLRAGATTGAFVVPAGDYDGTVGWQANDEGAAKYANRLAPAGPTEVAGVAVKPGRLLRLVARGLGDVALDLLGMGPPVGPVAVAFTIDNAGTVIRHCSQFPTCRFRPLADGAGAKLVCRGGVPDPDCNAAPDVSGIWALSGTQTAGCAAPLPPFEDLLTITQSGVQITAFGHKSYQGSVSASGFTLVEVPGPPDTTVCTIGSDVYDIFRRVEGLLPGPGPVPVTQSWALLPVTMQCPPCTATWEGTMVRVGSIGASFQPHRPSATTRMGPGVGRSANENGR